MHIKVSISLAEELVERIDRVGRVIGVKRSGMIQKMVERQLVEYEAFAASFGESALEQVKHDLPVGVVFSPSTYKDAKSGVTFNSGKKGKGRKNVKA